MKTDDTITVEQDRTLQVADVRNQLFKIIISAHRIERDSWQVGVREDAHKIVEYANDIAERLCVIFNEPTREELAGAMAEALNEKGRAG